MNKISYYGLIAYKCNSYDSCRGCTMASYNSGFDSYFSLNHTDLVEKISKIMYADKKSGYNEADHEFQILFDGLLVYDGVSGYPSNELFNRYWANTPEDEQTEEEYNAAENDGEQMAADALIIMQEAMALADKRLHDEQAAVVLAEKEATRKENVAIRLAKDAKDLIEYKRLQKKFNPQSPGEDDE